MGLMITDTRVQASVDRFFEKLEKYFPEHKVFALDSIDKDLRERLSELYKKVGCATAEEFLAAYGYQIITGDEVRKIRSFVLYTPGNEPDIIKNKVENMVSRLREYYPDGKIPGGLQKDHKNLSKSVSGLYQWLGYANAAELLTAYGFEATFSDKGGRPATNDYDRLLAILKEKYTDENRPKSIGILIHDNPEYAGQLKTLQNKANELFGMSLAKYLKENGVLASSPAKEKAETIAPKKMYHFFWVAVEGLEQPVPCATDKRTIHEGDYVEMCTIGNSAKLTGQVKETCYYTWEEQLPVPIESMYQFIRKLLKSELKEIEATKEKYLFCSVKLRDRHDSLYYLSPFEDIEVGDLVVVPHSWYGMIEGSVIEVRRVSEKTAPYPVKKTRKIEKISKRVCEERRKSAEAIDQMVRDCGVKAYAPQQVNKSAQAKFDQSTYFSSAVFRGFETNVQAALRIIYPADFDVMTHSKRLLDGIGQFECPSAFVPRILKDFPNLKAVFFAENWKEKMVYLAYSESGCTTVSSMRPIGNCDFYIRDRWSLAHDPTEESFTFQGGSYVFEEKSQWETCDFVLEDAQTQLAGQISIPSDPYRKRLTSDPLQIVKIFYPDVETFYTPAPKKPKTKTDTPLSENVANLSGKTFVVTGDLYHYDSREELKAIIEQAGGKMTGSVSSKTTALITNFPNSGTTKIRKAEECGIAIISEDEFIQRYVSATSVASGDDQTAILTEEDQKRQKDDEQLRREEEEHKRKEAEELKRREDEERERNMAAAYQRLEEEKQRRKESEEKKRLAEEERKRKEAEERNRREEEERKRREAAERERLAEEERERKEAEERQRREDEARQRKEVEELRRQEEVLAQARIAEQVHKAAEEERKRRELRAAEEARKAAEEQRRKEEAKKLSPEEKFEIEMADWNAKAAPILQQREEARQLLILQLRTQKLAEIEQKRNTQLADETRKKEALTAEKTSSEKKLAALGFLQFMEKNRTKSKIEQLTSDIAACDERMRTAEEVYQKDMGQLDKQVAKEVETHALELKLKYPLTRKPRKSIPGMSPAQLANAALKIAILETVASHGILSFTEIMNKCYALAGLNIPKVRPLVESLVQEGELIESKKQKNHEIHHYFEIAY